MFLRMASVRSRSTTDECPAEPGFLDTIGSWVLMNYFGRRTLYLGGLIVLMVLLIGIGGAGLAPAKEAIVQTKRAAGPAASSAGAEEVRVNVTASWAVGSLLLVFTLIYDFTVGPVCHAIVAESSSTRLRQKTIVIAHVMYNLCGDIDNLLPPAQLNSGRRNWEPRQVSSGSVSGFFSACGATSVFLKQVDALVTSSLFC